ncbi:MAG: hypothetical protein RBU21_18765 [FCB group bacterium]|jgi:hypothetical protein|nr:hypothetical protein [FCB group bacterium]
MKDVRRYLAMLCLLTLVLVISGCGWFIDKDRIVVAQIGERKISRGELAQVIRDMPDDERPLIRSRGDLRRTLEVYVDEQIRQDLAEKLGDKLNFPRKVAEAEFDARHPEYQGVQSMAAANVSEDYKIGRQEAQIMRDEREAGIDRVHKRNLGRAAVLYRAREAVKNNTLAATPEELAEEYRLRGNEFKRFETILFLAIRFPGNEATALNEAAKVMQRVQAGEKFETIAQQYHAMNPDLVFTSAIENNPDIEKFKGFWQQASGAEPGQVIGPIFMPRSDRVDQQTGAVEQVGGGVVNLMVVERTPERQKSLEEATPELMQPIIEAKMMEQLRAEYDVKIFADKLPDPSFTDEQGPPTS